MWKEGEPGLTPLTHPMPIHALLSKGRCYSMIVRARMITILLSTPLPFPPNHRKRASTSSQVVMESDSGDDVQMETEGNKCEEWGEGGH